MAGVKVATNPVVCLDQKVWLDGVQSIVSGLDLLEIDVVVTRSGIFRVRYGSL